jgi:hypothetical protein
MVGFSNANATIAIWLAIIICMTDNDSNVLGWASLMAALGFAFVVLDMCVFFFSAAVSTKDSFRLWLEPLLLSLLKLNLDFDLGLPVGFVDE